jgi:hypothetical protein
LIKQEHQGCQKWGVSVMDCITTTRQSTPPSSSLGANGQVEGQIHRLKLVKRQMYSRAKFNLMRRRVLPYVAAAVTVSPQGAP